MEASSAPTCAAAKAGALSATRSVANRFVRLDTGSSRLAVLASHTVVMASGAAGIPASRASASMTGVSSTAVVSRLSRTVVTAANSTHSRNSAAKLPRPGS